MQDQPNVENPWAIPIYSVENMEMAEELMKRIGQKAKASGKYYLTLPLFQHEEADLPVVNVIIHDIAEALREEQKC